MRKSFGSSKKSSTFASAIERDALLTRSFAEIAQLVEHNLAKVGVAGPSPVFRSQIEQKERLGKALIINCPGGGIGRRARFRCVCRKACRFESCSGHSFFQYVKICWRGGGIGRRATLRG